jgi:hypothetical protein
MIGGPNGGPAVAGHAPTWFTLTHAVLNCGVPRGPRCHAHGEYADTGTQDLRSKYVQSEGRNTYDNSMLEDIAGFWAQCPRGTSTGDTIVTCPVTHEVSGDSAIATNWKRAGTAYSNNKASLQSLSPSLHATDADSASDGPAFPHSLTAVPLTPTAFWRNRLILCPRRHRHRTTVDNFRCNRPRKTISSLRAACCYIITQCVCQTCQTCRILPTSEARKAPLALRCGLTHSQTGMHGMSRVDHLALASSQQLHHSWVQAIVPVGGAVGPLHAAVRAGGAVCSNCSCQATRPCARAHMLLM